MISMMVMTVVGMAVIGYRPVGMLYTSIRQVGMIVMVLIPGKSNAGTRAKQGSVFFAFGNGRGGAVATHMTVQTHHQIGGSHYQMQVMGDQ